MRRMFAILTVFALLLPVAIAILGCDDDNDTPKAKCESLLATYCDRVDECSSDISYRECMISTAVYVNCDDAVSVTDNYPTCMTDIRSAGCDSIQTALPSSCSGVILQ